MSVQDYCDFDEYVSWILQIMVFCSDALSEQKTVARYTQKVSQHLGVDLESMLQILSFNSNHNDHNHNPGLKEALNLL